MQQQKLKHLRVIWSQIAPFENIWSETEQFF
jgi:hypothetical protein